MNSFAPESKEVEAALLDRCQAIGEVVGMNSPSTSSLASWILPRLNGRPLDDLSIGEFLRLKSEWSEWRERCYEWALEDSEEDATQPVYSHAAAT